MAKVPFLFPEIESEFMKGFVRSVGEKSRVLRERYMLPENVLRFSHGENWEAPANTLGDQAGTMETHGTDTKLELSDIVAGRTEVISNSISQITADLNSQMERVLIETMSNAVEKTGQIVDGSNKTFPESMYEVLETMRPSLDDEGELSMPTMFYDQSQRKKLEEQYKSAGREFEEKLLKLKERKKIEAQELEKERLSRFERPQT